MPPSATGDVSNPDANPSTSGTVNASSSTNITSRLSTTAKVVLHHVIKHTGVGIVCAVAYFDPGNWGVDLQAGSQFGYKLLFVVLLAGLFAVFLQVLASRLGCVTGLDLASNCRLLLYNRPKHPHLYRWLLLYPLYALSEIAIISTDLAELLGSAIALCLLFPTLPLWAGVLLTASDVILLLALRDPLGGRPVRMFELLIAALVFIVLVCMAVIISKVGVDWNDAFDGFVPSSTLFKSGGLYASIGIIGATVMPHSLFLGSALATQNRVTSKQTEKPLLQPVSTGSSAYSSDADVSAIYKPRRFSFRALLPNFKRSFVRCFKIVPLSHYANEPKSHADRENHPYAFVRAHIYHGTVDVVISLLGLAVIINSMILVLASAVFFLGPDAGSGGPASLFDAHDLLKRVVGKPVATLFAIALLAAGQSSSIIATMAGQTVSEGFLRWRISPIFRRLITRCLGLIPSLAIAIGVGRSGVDTLLIASQVALSIVLPFIVFPLLLLTSSKTVMSVKKPIDGNSQPSSSASIDRPTEPAAENAAENTDLESASEQMVDYSNGKITASVGYLIWVIVLAANVYAIVSLAMGKEG